MNLFKDALVEIFDKFLVRESQYLGVHIFVVLAQAGRRTDIERADGQLDRPCLLITGSDFGMLHTLKEALVCQLRIFKQFFVCFHHSGRYTRLLHERHHFFRREVDRPLLDESVKFVLVFLLPMEGSKPLIPCAGG